MAVKLSFKGVGSGASKNEAQKETAEQIEALQAQKKQPSGGKKWNLHISQCGIRTPIIVSSIVSSANRENDLFLLADKFTSASISQNSSTTSQVKLDLRPWSEIMMDQQDGGGMQRRWASLKTVDEAAASDVDSELRPPLDATATTVYRPDVQDLIARTLVVRLPLDSMHLDEFSETESRCFGANDFRSRNHEGAHALSINDGYGGMFIYFLKAASQLQDLETIFVDFNSATDEKALASIRPNIKLIWIETPTNTTLRLIPIAHITSIIYSLPAL
ncbi:hypothetical protein M422DRAFT_267222 [Sphaerobolus stellatus SS14]|uniref:Uncharacterized protein n=1 Tax=Sphaerobolus stellatus (strain SS14) TaxID=990650 RepID=A0A0C9U9G1_SPHS4|nr:hypothetical protein M422DRAFT_267222 [Sphaerobolus stellatus SS14]